MDDTEETRRKMLATGEPERELLHADKRWTTQELAEEFEILGFLAPFVIVQRKSDGVKGSLLFSHSPRVYFSFKPD
jgi:hypothetical protein